VRNGHPQVQVTWPRTTRSSLGLFTRNFKARTSSYGSPGDNQTSSRAFAKDVDELQKCSAVLRKAGIPDCNTTRTAASPPMATIRALRERPPSAAGPQPTSAAGQQRYRTSEFDVRSYSPRPVRHGRRNAAELSPSGLAIADCTCYRQRPAATSERVTSGYRGPATMIGMVRVGPRSNSWRKSRTGPPAAATDARAHTDGLARRIGRSLTRDRGPSRRASS